MPVTVEEDLVEGSRFTYGPNGGRDVMRFNVYGLTAGPGIRGQAYNNLPYPYGEPHPTIENLFATEFDIMPFLNARDACKATIVFLPPDFSNLNAEVYTFNGTVRMTRSNFDNTGERILVNYTPTGGEEEHATGEIEAPKAYGILVVEKFFDALPTFALTYENSLNANPWNGGNAFTWWCREISFQYVQFTGKYRTRMVFEYDPETHVRVAAWRDSNGFIPEDIDTPVDRSVLGEFNGWTTCLPEGMTIQDFSSLDVEEIFA